MAQIVNMLAERPAYSMSMCLSQAARYLDSTMIIRICLGWIILMSSSDLKAASQVGAGLSVNPVPAGEATIYQLQVMNGQPDALPEFPEIQGIRADYTGQSRNSNVQIVNGRMQQNQTLVYQWRLIAETEGVYLIPPIQVRVEGKALQAPSVQLRVSKGINYDEYAFIKLDLPRTSFYEGEPFTFTVDLYELNAQTDKAPDIEVDGLVIERISDNFRTSRQMVGNRAYNRLSLDYTARSVRHGELTLGPMTWPVSLVFRQNARSRSFFDSFFDQGTRREVVLKAPPQKLVILPLPEEGRPESFGGAIGQYTMAMKASPLKLKVGDPITIAIDIVGQGALDTIQMPPIDHWVGFKTYPPSAETVASDQTGIKGSRRFEQVVIPQSSDIQALPGLSFAYFDPRKAEYQTIDHPAMAIEVLPNPQAPSVVSVAPESNTEVGLPKPRPQDIVPIKPFIGAGVVLAQPWIFQSRFYGIQTLPLFLVGLIWSFKRWQDWRNSDTHQIRRKEVDQWLKQQFPVLESYAQKGEGEAFFELLFRMLQERAGQYLDRSPASITESVVEDASLMKHLTPDLQERLRYLFHACNQARYAPESDHQRLGELVDAAREVMAKLT